jgi:multidrug resistance protein
MANEKPVEPYGSSFPDTATSADDVVDSIPGSEATPTQTDNANLNNKSLVPNSVDVDQNVEGGADEVSNSNKLQTPSPSTGPDYSIFPSKLKFYIIIMTVFGTLFSPFSAFIYITSLTPIAQSYHRSLSDINFTVTVYQVMQAIAPLFFGDLSDQIGRRPVYIITFTIYIAANIGLALQHNYAALMVLRALQSTGSSATVAIGSAVVADITTSAERGGFITAVQASVLFAPALAPVLGGILTQYLGWRSTFWFLVIGAGIFLITYVPFVPEVSVVLSGIFK